MTYAATEIQGLLKRGPHAGEDFFRMKVTGNGETRWVNITPAQLASIGAVLNDQDEAQKVYVAVWHTEGGLEAQAYHTEAAAQRDFPEESVGLDSHIIESTVQD